jgi:hypothetical protein
MAKKGATQSGASAGNTRAKDQARAAALKKAGIERTSGRCPICNAIVSTNSFQNHIATHK